MICRFFLSLCEYTRDLGLIEPPDIGPPPPDKRKEKTQFPVVIEHVAHRNLEVEIRVLRIGAHQFLRTLGLLLLFLPLKKQFCHLIHSTITQKAQLHLMAGAGNRNHGGLVIQYGHYGLSRLKGGLFFFYHRLLI